MIIRKLTKNEVDHPESDWGYFGVYGAVIGDTQKIIVDADEGFYLVTRDCFEFKGMSVRIKEEYKEQLSMEKQKAELKEIYG